MKIAVVPEWWVFLIAIALLVLLVFWDYKSRSKRWRVWRISAIFLIMLALLGLYMKPYIRVDGESIKVALLTDSIVPFEMDSLKKAEYKIAENLDAYLQVTKSQSIDEMVVVGDGLEAWELDQLKHTFTYLPPSKKVEGLLEMSAGEVTANTISPLTFRISLNEPMGLHLSGTGIESTIKSVASDEQKIAFDINPQVTGNLTYQLHGVREGDTLFSELIPMKIKERSGFNTLILTNAPSFEVRFLKNLLKEEGYGVAERLQLSKGTFREAFSNLETRSLTRLTKTMLEDFKLVITDKDSYDQLSYSEKQNVSAALKKGSIGVVWMSNESNEWIKTRQAKTQTISLKSGQQTVELETSGVTSSVYDQQIPFQGNNIGHLHEIGLGKVMLPLLSSTYQIKLKGHDGMYSKVWNAMLQPVVGFELSGPEVSLPNFPRVNEPMIITFRSSDDEEVYLDSARVAVKEQWHQPGVFTAMAWPKAKGWNSMKIGTDRYAFFVFDAEDWQAQKVFQKQTQTTNYANRSASDTTDSITFDRPISQWIFFFVIVLSFGFLWVETRVN
jgi:hypothetical protein